jgi:hypothetical protein
VALKACEEQSFSWILKHFLTNFYEKIALVKYFNREPSRGLKTKDWIGFKHGPNI